MKTITITVYTFDELSEKAKENARDWYRQGVVDDDWFEPVYDDARELFSLCGFRIGDINFSRFSAQGDGACFTGSWSSEHVQIGALQAPLDKELHRIAREAERLAKTGASFTVKHSGQYYHKYCTAFAIEIPDMVPESGINQLEEDLKEMARDAMEWIYQTLAGEYDYLLSDESVDESIRSNEYTFTDTGKREG